MKTIKILLFVILSLLITSTYAQFGGIASGVTANVAITQIKDGLQDVVNKSLDRADYSMAKAAIQALGAIDAWKQANMDLLETAFNELDEKSRNLFSNTSVLINQAGGIVKQNLETTRQITENANQITESIIGSGKRSFILRYYPNVISPLNNDSVLVRLRGVNLDKANLRVILPGNIKRNVQIVGPQEVSFWIPISVLPNNEKKHQVFEVKVYHRTRNGSKWIFWPKYEEIDRTLLFGILPKQAGSYNLTATRSFQKEEIITYTADMGRFSGRNTNVQKVAMPPFGYKWDLRGGVSVQNRFEIVSTGGGEAGRCQEINWSGSNENGIIGTARCDQIRELSFSHGFKYDDGYKYCGIRGPVYRFIPTTENIAPKSGEIVWKKDEVLNLPSDVSSFTLSVKSYTGAEKIITNSYSDDNIEVLKDMTRLIIRTKIPPDIIN